MIEYETLNELKRLSGKVRSDAPFSQQDEPILQRTFNFYNIQYIKFIERLLSCVKILSAEKRSLESELQIQQEKNKILMTQIDELTEENQRMKKEMESYNGTVLQRARVKSGTVKPAEKAKPTKEEVQNLLKQGLSRDEIAAKYEISRTTLWRVLKD